MLVFQSQFLWSCCIYFSLWSDWPTTAIITVDVRQSSSSLPPLPTSCTLIMPSPYSSIIWQWIPVGKTCFAHENQTSLSSFEMSKFPSANAHQLIPQMTADWFLQHLLHVTPTRYLLPQKRMLNTKVTDKEGLLFEHAYHYDLILHTSERLI